MTDRARNPPSTGARHRTQTRRRVLATAATVATVGSAGSSVGGTDRVNEINDEIGDVAAKSEQQTAKVFKVVSGLKQLSEAGASE